MTQELFSVDQSIVRFEGLRKDVQVVFHAMNKSGSLAMAKLMMDAFAINRRSGECVSHFHRELTQQAFLDLVDDDRDGRLFIDHYLYGSLKPRPGRVYVTQFRHPLPRMLSVYNWLKTRHPNFPELKTFIEQSRGLAHSTVIQLAINWNDIGTDTFGAKLHKLSASEAFERSMSALEREIYAISVAEYFEESIFLYATLLDLPKVPAWHRDKRNEDRLLSTEVDREVIELIEHVNRADFLLYAHAVERFWKQFCAPEQSKLLASYKSACEAEYRDRILQSAPIRAI